MCLSGSGDRALLCPEEGLNFGVYDAEDASVHSTQERVCLRRMPLMQLLSGVLL
jgi:hypothetical protein